MSIRGKGRARGLSLVELLLFIVIVSAGIAGILAVYNTAVKSSADPVAPKQALAIAEAILEEVSLAAFSYCDPLDANFDTATGTGSCASMPETNRAPEPGETRPYDNIDDYHNPGLLAVTDVGGNPVGGLDSYRYSVAVAAADLGSIPAASGDALRIAVTVTGPGNTSVTLEGYRARYAPNAGP